METVDLEFHLYKARIFKRMGVNDDRLQVRILPFMYDIKETDSLPCYPCLFKGQFVNGWAENDKRPEGVEADNVLVMATNDFTYGYIIADMNLFNSPNTTEKYTSGSWGYKTFNSYLSGRGLKTETYDDLVVQNWCFNDKGDSTGGLIELYNYKTGTKYIFNSSGTCIVVAADKIFLRCGSPKKAQQDAGVANAVFSQIEMTPDSITLKAPKIFLDASKSLALGTSGHNLLTTASIVDSGVMGMNLHPITTITA